MRNFPNFGGNDDSRIKTGYPQPGEKIGDNLHACSLRENKAIACENSLEIEIFENRKLTSYIFVIFISSTGLVRGRKNSGYNH